MTRTVVWSYGGGVQSAAIGVLIKRGKLPRPDLAVMADTSREGTATWQYLNGAMRPYLNKIGIQIQIAPHELTKWDLWYKNGCALPLYHETGKFETYCSANWKRDVIGRWLRQCGVKACDEWIGFSYDELRRVKSDRQQWRHRVYPLIDMILSRADCLQILEDEGLPVPPKSACWCCPHRNNQEWRFLRDNYLNDWVNACVLESEIRERDHGVWLHRDRKPLAQCDIDSDTRLDVGQCGLGYCFL